MFFSGECSVYLRNVRKLATSRCKDLSAEWTSTTNHCQSLKSEIIRNASPVFEWVLVGMAYWMGTSLPLTEGELGYYCCWTGSFTCSHHEIMAERERIGKKKRNEGERVRTLTRKKIKKNKEERERRFWRSNKGDTFNNRRNEHKLNSSEQWRVLRWTPSSFN